MKNVFQSCKTIIILNFFVRKLDFLLIADITMILAKKVLVFVPLFGITTCTSVTCLQFGIVAAVVNKWKLKYLFFDNFQFTYSSSESVSLFSPLRTTSVKLNTLLATLAEGQIVTAGKGISDINVCSVANVTMTGESLYLRYALLMKVQHKMKHTTIIIPHHILETKQIVSFLIKAGQFCKYE